MGFSLSRMVSDLKIYGKSSLRSREGFFFTLVFPIILILLFGAIFSGGGASQSTVYVQNHDTGPVGATFISALNSTSNYCSTSSGAGLCMRPVPADLNFSQYLSSKSASDGIIIPANFSLAFESGQKVNVTVFGNPSSTASAVVSGIVAEVVNGFNLHGATGVHQVGITPRTAVSSNYKYIDFLVPGLVGFAALTSPMFAMVNISSTYRRDKVFKLLSLTPLTKTEWLLSKIIWYVGTTAVSFMLMAAVGVYAFGAHIALNWGIGIFLVLGPFFFVSLGMLVGSVSNTPEAASVVGNLVTFPMMFLSGTFFPVSSMPKYLQGIAHVLPLYYMIDGLNEVMIYGNFGAAYFDMAVLLGISVVVFALAVRFFRWRED
ncbi:MAG: ABC transporter permease [Nitrososphaerota archaeon]|jgi:ABC-2 type transport system permease protein|nr:ABC transporter permease [Nitrososphaerota archaeon]MCL5672028.1 ABC transporter permease [Nitrososphaerota archaeon]MDG6903694.1 ABC transporter permease [Nitrososphaerota archaeon]MDG6911979.1 ABC transporter permease [Nitrososphaerota archaeon]MDG6943256.1 ABC transporter permease [Nitrososphaerota archaeon]